MTISEVIFEQVVNDDEPHEKKSAKLAELYEAADATGRDLIDNVLMTICGWRFETLQQMAQSRGMSFVETLTLARKETR